MSTAERLMERFAATLDAQALLRALTEGRGAAWMERDRVCRLT